MNFSEFANKIHPNLAGISNQGQFVGGLFNAAGDTHFPLNPSYDTYDLQKKMVNGTRKINPKMKNRFPSPIDTEGLHNFFSRRIGETTLPIIMRNFGIPESEPEHKEFFIRALCTQFQNIVTEASNEVNDIVATEYFRLLKESGAEIKSDAPYYPGDNFHITDQIPERKHTYNFYQDFKHQWKIKNMGTVTWENRYLECINQSDIRIKAKNKIIKIPKVKPGDEVYLITEFNSRGIEGDYDALWEMKDIDGNLCFPNKETQLRVVVTVSNGDENRLEA
jgi:hypothetical protein